MEIQMNEQEAIGMTGGAAQFEHTGKLEPTYIIGDYEDKFNVIIGFLSRIDANLSDLKLYTMQIRDLLSEAQEEKVTYHPTWLTDEA
jgi:hypothetical protein